MSGGNFEHRVRARSLRLRGLRGQGGGVLIEFSISIIALWLIAAATIDLGRALAASHVLQGAARASVRELAHRENIAFNENFGNAVGEVFNPDFLVIDAACLEREARDAVDGKTPDEVLDDLLRGAGALNLMLRPLMVFERVAIGGQEQLLLRYPGALMSTDSAPNSATCEMEQYTVAIPVVDDAQSQIVLRSVVEELVPDAFSLTGAPATVPPGTATLRLHYPFQAVALTEWRLVDGVNRPVGVDDREGYRVDDERQSERSQLNQLDARGPDGELLAYAVAGERQIPVYGGTLGLGSQELLSRQVRPYRRVITAEAMAPRELVGPSWDGPAS